MLNRLLRNIFISLSYKLTSHFSKRKMMAYYLQLHHNSQYITIGNKQLMMARFK